MPWSVVGYTVLYRQSEPATSSGVLVIAFTPPKSTQRWRVEMVACSCTSTDPTNFFVYDRTPGSSVPAGGTVKGNLTFGTFNPGITILPSGLLVCVWTGATVGAVGSVRVQFAVIAGSPATPTPVSA